MVQLRIPFFLFLGVFLLGLPLVWSVQELSIQEIDATLQGEKVIVKGFFHRGTDAMAYLTLQPNVRSCCLGAERKAHEQVILGKTIEYAGSGPVRIEGRLHVVDGYRLDEPRLLPANTGGFPWITAWVLCGGALAVVVFRWIFNAKQTRRDHAC